MNPIPRQALKRASPQETFRGDVAILDVGDEGWLNPCGLGLLDGLGELGLWADDRIELLRVFIWRWSILYRQLD